MPRSAPLQPLAVFALTTLVISCGNGTGDMKLKDSGTPVGNTPCFDNDGDGYPGTGDCDGVTNFDCDDHNPDVHPQAAEICDGIDNDCNGKIDDGLPTHPYYSDADGDGYGTATVAGQGCGAPPHGEVEKTGDCNDSNAAIHPGAVEVCNGIDDDCNGLIDDGLPTQNFYPDADGDGYGDASAAPQTSCMSSIPGKVPNDLDCDDSDPTVKPGATELCNKRDDNCDGLIDNGITYTAYYPDADGDGHGAAGSTPQEACAPIPGMVTNDDDCNDMDPSVKPGAPEVCNGVDDNCNGMIDEGLTFTNYYPDVDGDGYGASGVTPVNACAPIPGRVTTTGDCNDNVASIHPGATELCNGIDDNCNGMIDEGLTFSSYYPDADGDGFGNKNAAPQSSCAPVAGKVTNNQDCDDSKFSVKPGAAELCNGVDDNCNGQIDEGLTFTNYYPDVDSDGYGSSTAMPQSSCAPVPGKVTNNTDCNDAVSTIHPGAPETCNGIDDNCDGLIDNGTVTQNYYPDADGDGYGASGSTPISSCAPISGRVTNSTDCNDANAAVHPGATELCNGVDDNCNGTADEGLTFLSYYPDADFDGFGSASAGAQSACAPVAGKVTNNTDCNDANAAIHPGAAEVCNGVDDNCNGTADEGNPGGGAACSTGQFGVCSAGTRVCTGGSLQCTRTTGPSVEVCNGLDDDCNGSVDETFPDKGTACSAGLGVCLRSGVKVCTANGSATVCNVDAGSPTPPACDGLDNDCDGIVDEPYLSATTNLATTTDWNDIEVAPYYYSAGGCAGGVNGTGTVDALAGGALVMGVGSAGLYFQKLDVTGTPVGNPVAAISSLTYDDVALAQAADGFLLAGIYAGGPGGTGDELDLYYVDASTGALRTFTWSLFHSTHVLDSLRVVRGNGNRVVLIWREAGVGVRYFRVEPTYNAAEDYWDLVQVGGATLDTSVLPLTLVAGTTIPAGLGADSAIIDWDATQTCQAVTTDRQLGVAYRSTAVNIHYFTVNENGGSKSAETDIRTGLAAPITLGEPDVAFYRDGTTNSYFISYSMNDPTDSVSDLEVWLSNAPGYDYAWYAYATVNGAASIVRPRASATDSRIWVSAERYVPDASGFERQVMTRVMDFSGNPDPASTTVELPITSGSCSGDPPCRGGNKDGFTNWAAFGKVYYGATGSSPTGAFASTLTCQ